MVSVEQYGKFKPEGNHKKKTQIILCHSSREVEDYLTSLKFRYNKKFDKLPHYVITKSGKVLQLLDDSTYSKFFFEDSINKHAIVICLENLGWLEKKPLSTEYINWNGSIYNQIPYEKKWRDYFFWEPYTEQQLESLTLLCNELCDKFEIEKKFTGHNTKINGIRNFRGIVSRSNFDERFTDLNPSFNFDKFLKKFRKLGIVTGKLLLDFELIT